jgi:hypothetical protein
MGTQTVLAKDRTAPPVPRHHLVAIAAAAAAVCGEDARIAGIVRLDSKPSAWMQASRPGAPKPRGVERQGVPMRQFTKQGALAR